MSESAEQRWARAFEAFSEDEATLRALALGFPIRARGLVLGFEPPELRGAVVPLASTSARAVVLPLSLRGPSRATTAAARIGFWPSCEGELLRVGDLRVAVPERPETLVAGLGARLAPGALSELISMNIERLSAHGAPSPEELVAGAERLMARVSEALLERLGADKP